MTVYGGHIRFTLIDLHLLLNIGKMCWTDEDLYANISTVKHGGDLMKKYIALTGLLLMCMLSLAACGTAGGNKAKAAAETAAAETADAGSAAENEDKQDDCCKETAECCTEKNECCAEKNDDCCAEKDDCCEETENAEIPDCCAG